MAKLLSIVVPVYKVEKYINKCVDSILMALHGFEDQYELILVNDGSPDNCGKICDEYAIRHINISVLHKENGGLSDARNFGINKATGEYIAFIDSDDWVTKDMGKIFDLFKQKPGFDAFQFGYIGVDESGEILKELFYTDNNFSYLDLMTTIAWVKIVRREFIINNDLFFVKGRLSEDVDWSFRLYLSNAKFFISDINFYRYFITREGSIMKTLSLEYINNHIIKSLNECWIMLKRTKVPKSLFKKLRKYLLTQANTTIVYASRFDRQEQEKFVQIFKQNRKLFAPSSFNTWLLYSFIKLFGLRNALKILVRLKK